MYSSYYKWIISLSSVLDKLHFSHKKYFLGSLNNLFNLNRIIFINNLNAIIKEMKKFIGLEKVKYIFNAGASREAGSPSRITAIP